MKLILIIVSALVALVAADVTNSTTTTAAAPTTTAVNSEEAQCAKSCDPKDTCCIAKCWKVPCPSDNQANDTNKCVSACPQGTGTPADTQKYADCEQSCYKSHFFPANGAAATGTAQSTINTTLSGNRAAETGSHTTGTATAASGTGMTTTTGGTKSSDSHASNTSTATSSHSSAASTKNAASDVKMGASGAGFFCLVLAAFAL